MPWMNWKKHDQSRADALSGSRVVLERTESGDGRVALRMAISSDLATQLITALESAWVPSEPTGTYPPELRLDLPSNWSIFWKARDGESRLLLAKPELDHWVATIAVGREDVLPLLERLKARAGETDFAQELSLHRVSNFNLLLTVQD